MLNQRIHLLSKMQINSYIPNTQRPWRHSRFTNSAAYAIINIGEFQCQNIIQQKHTVTPAAYHAVLGNGVPHIVTVQHYMVTQ